MCTEDPRDPGRALRLVVGAAIVDDLVVPTRVLAARRTGPAPLAGGWELPGGKVEPDESPILALHREIQEELGVPIRIGEPVTGPLPSGTWPLGDRYEMLVWLAVVEEGRPEALEDHDQLRWLTRATVRDVPWLPADRPIAEAIAAVLRSVDGPAPRS
jgi:8-oxo-dGTP diphosphatase